MNFLIFGPNGSGKGTQGAQIRQKFGIAHIESGVIFRENISGGTALGEKAKKYINRGDLVPDEVTIPMILNRLQEEDCKKGWLLDGFPRNKVQAQSLDKALKEAEIELKSVIEIVLARETAKQRIMGRRLCVNDNNHPNHIAFESIKPVEKEGKLVCRVCGGELKTRPDDQDEVAIIKRHNIYYDEVEGTMAAVNYFKNLKNVNVVSVDGSKSISEVTADILQKLS